MEVITIQSEAYNALIAKLEAIERSQATESPEDIWITNEKFCQLLNISKRTAQHYRDSGLVAFSKPQPGAKVYYKLADVHAMLEKHKRLAFR